MNKFISKEFEPTSSAGWKQKIQVDLKGADYNETLLTKTNEGITIKPFYHLDEFEKLDIPTPSTDFKICEKILVENDEQANKAALNAINGGAEAILFVVYKPFSIPTLFTNLEGKNINFHFKFMFFSAEFVSELSTFLTKETCYFNIDIIGHLALTGNWHSSLNDDFENLEKLRNLNNHSLIGINAGIYQNAGANIVQQVAYALAHTNEYLNKFGSEIASKIQYNFAVGGNYFFEIAKIRAFRYLHKQVLAAYNTEVEAAIYAEPSLRNKTIYDYNVNMLRTTTEGMSAILGGATTVSNTAYDSIFHKSNEFGSRISRNQLIVLKEESYFSNAAGIATDSYYIESLTKQIAENALELFKDIEKSGGFLHQLKEGTIQRKIQEQAAKEQEDFDNNKLILLGTNKYPNKLDQMKNDLELNPFSTKRNEKTLLIPIRPKRLAEELEQKRLEDEA